VLSAGRRCARAEPPDEFQPVQTAPLDAQSHKPPGAARRKNRAKTVVERRALILWKKSRFIDEKTGNGYNSKRWAQQTAQKDVDNQ
jgi:hypothetical protein